MIFEPHLYDHKHRQREKIDFVRMCVCVCVWEPEGCYDQHLRGKLVTERLINIIMLHNSLVYIYNLFYELFEASRLCLSIIFKSLCSKLNSCTDIDNEGERWEKKKKEKRKKVRTTFERGICAWEGVGQMILWTWTTR